MTDVEFAVRAQAELLIEAEPEEVWRVLTDFAGWPQWNEGMEKHRLVQAAQPLAAGGTFAWRTRGMTLTGRLTDVEPPCLIRWTGRAPGVRAVHTYRLDRVAGPPGHTLVRAGEELSGWLARMSRRKLAAQAHAGLPRHLQGLKRRSERQPVLSSAAEE